MGSNALFQVALADAETGKLSTAGRFTAGFGAGVLEAVVVVTPFEVNFFRSVLLGLFVKV